MWDYWDVTKDKRREEHFDRTSKKLAWVCKIKKYSLIIQNTKLIYFFMRKGLEIFIKIIFESFLFIYEYYDKYDIIAGSTRQFQIIYSFHLHIFVT